MNKIRGFVIDVLELKFQSEKGFGHLLQSANSIYLSPRTQIFPRKLAPNQFVEDRIVALQVVIEIGVVFGVA